MRGTMHTADGPMPVPEFPRLNDYLDCYVAHTPDATAQVCHGERSSYRGLHAQVQQAARALLAWGIRAGDRVALLCTPRAEYWCLFLATIRIGAIWVGLNPRYRSAELRYIAGDCAPRLLLALTELEGRNYREEIGAVVDASGEALPPVSLAGDAVPGLTPLADFLRAGETVSEASLTAAQESVRPGSPAMIVYTSGSSGRPKGALISQHGLAAGARMQTRHLDLWPQSLGVNFPINHVACVADTCATTLVTGGKIVFQERFDPEAMLRAVADERCNMLGGVPTMLQLMLDHPAWGAVDLSSVQLIAWGGAAMPLEGIRRLQRLGVRLMTLYGLTETSANVVFGDGRAGIDGLAQAIGIPDRDVACRIVDDSGSPCAVGEEGELQIRADFLFLGYWGRDDATREAWSADGWFRTGDIARQRADGGLELKGRRSEMYKSGGYNVYPREIEQFLESLASVALAAVVDVPDPLYQEVGHAWVMAAPGFAPSEEALRAACRDALANYKVPKRFTVVEALPMLPVGKVDKQRLRAMARDAARETGRGGPAGES